MITFVGRKPGGTKGQKFERWDQAWAPLWELCLALVPSLKDPTFASGTSVSAEQASTLAIELKDVLDSGKAAEWIETKGEHPASLPDLPCKWCNGTGTRTDEVGVKMGMDKRKWCNACDGTGMVKDPRRDFSVSLEDVQAFQQFVRESGGF